MFLVVGLGMDLISRARTDTPWTPRWSVFSQFFYSREFLVSSFHRSHAGRSVQDRLAPWLEPLW
jgi:hypothetical protein